MHKNFCFIFIFLLIFKDLHAEEVEDVVIPLSNLEQGVSPIVHGCVNVITGDYVDGDADIVIQGPEPLIFERYYCSSLFRRTGFHAWKHSHQISVFKHKEDINDKTETIFTYSSEGGRSVNLREDSANKQTFFRFSRTFNKGGFTNCGNGTLGALTNLKNTKLSYDPKKHLYEINTIDGSKQSFSKRDDKLYVIDKEVRRNGQLVTYKYNSSQKIEEIRFTNSTGKKVYGQLQFSYKQDCITLKGSDGQEVRYGLKPWKKMHRLISVDSDHAPKISFEYEKKSEYVERGKDHSRLHIVEKKGPGDRSIRSITYYKKSDRIKDIKFIENQVKSISEPTGTDSKPHEIFHFTYDLDNRCTDVVDAFGHKTRYHYTPEMRLSKVETYLGKKLYSQERYGWGLETENLGNLLYTCLEEGNGKILKAQCFKYDSFGNVLSESLYGNITGHSKPILWNVNTPRDNGCDCYTTKYTYNERHLVDWQKDSNGRVTVYEYDAADRLIAKFLKFNRQIILREFFDYDEDGVLICNIKDDGSTNDRASLQGVTERHITRIQPTQKAPYGLPAVVETLYFDLSSRTEKLLKRVENKFSGRGQLEQQTHYDSENKYAYTLAWTYDKHGNCIKETKETKETNVLKHSVGRTYDENDNLVEEWGPQPGYKKVNTYDFADRLISSTEINSSDVRLTTTMQYDLMGRLTSSVDPFGHETRHIYDELGREIETIHPSIGSLDGSLITPTEKKEYDVLGNVTLHKKGHQGATTASYNILGKPINIIHPDNSTESFEYNIDGTLKQSVDKTGLKTCYKYDYAGRVIEKEVYSSENALLKKESNSYNAFHLLSSTDCEGRITYYNYDYAGRLVTIVKGEERTDYAYDTSGRQTVTRECYASNAYRETFKTYDFLDQLLEERVQDSQNPDALISTQYTYDLVGNVTKEIQKTFYGVSITTTEYNSFNQPISVTDALGNITKITYQYNKLNTFGQRIFKTIVTDPSGNKTITKNNPRGQPEQVTHKDAFGTLLSKQEIFYNRLGSVIAKRNTILSQGKNLSTVTTAWQRDSQNRLTKMVEASGTAQQRITEYRYNPFGQKEAIRKPDGNEIRFEYDALGRLRRYYSLDHSVDYLYTYDHADRLTEIFDQVAKTKTTREYDFNGCLERETLANGLEIKYTYDPLKRPTRVILPDQTSIHYAYDAIYLRTVTRENSHGELLKHEYTHYDQSGLLVQSKLAGSVGNVHYTFDPKMRLNEIRADKIAVKASYDLLDNMVSRSVHFTNAHQEDNFSYNALNQLIGEKGSETHTYVPDSLYNYIARDGVKREITPLQQLIQEGDNSYRYDANGNLTNKEGKEPSEYIYDGLDRLVAVMQGDQRTEYKYDPFNRRISKTQFHRSNGTWIQNQTENYLYQGQNEIGTMVEGKITQLRVLGEGLGAEIGAAVLLELNQKAYVPLHDIQGDVIALFNPDGSLEESYQYTAFGAEKIFNRIGEEVENSLVNNPWRFSSKRVDAETGFVYFGRRYYDPHTLRWVTPDPIGYEGGPNLYAYANNNPLIHFDLYGLEGIGYNFKWSMNQNSNSSANSLFDTRLPPLRNFSETLQKADARAGERFASRIIRPVTYSPRTSRPLINQKHLLSFNINSGNYKVGRRLYDGIGFGITHGIDNNFEDHSLMLHYVSHGVGGREVSSTFYESTKIEGMAKFVDINYLKMNTTEVKNTAIRIENSLRRNRIHIEIVHSNGAAVLYHVIKNLISPELRHKLFVIALAPARIINKYELGIGGAYNFVADPVPYISDPLGIAELLFYDRVNNQRTIFFPGWDNHGFFSNTNQHAWRSALKDLKNKNILPGNFKIRGYK